MTRRKGASSSVRVSALVSLYGAGRFVRGCLQSLVEQTLFKRGEMEVLCRDAASPENEGAVVREFQQRFPNIHYAREPERVPLYESWNRAALEARGTYLLAASADDRLGPDGAETLARALDARGDCDIAYGDWVEVPVDLLDRADAMGLACRAGEFAHLRLLRHFFLGSQPMWRRAAHHAAGGFDVFFRIVGDHDLFLRLTAGGRRAVHVSRILGRIGRHTGALSASRELPRETAALLDRWLTPQEIGRRGGADGANCDPAALLADFAAHSLCAWPSWKGGAPEIFNDRIERVASFKDGKSRLMGFVLAARACLWGDWEQAAHFWTQVGCDLGSGLRIPEEVPIPMRDDVESAIQGEVVIPAGHDDGLPRLHIRRFHDAYFGASAVDRFLARMTKVPPDQPLVVWGASTKGGLVRSLLRRSFRDIAYFLDSRGSGTFAGCRVLAPETVRGDSPSPFIVVSLDPRAHDDVVRRLDALGQPRSQWICFPER